MLFQLFWHRSHQQPQAFRRQEVWQRIRHSRQHHCQAAWHSISSWYCLQRQIALNLKVSIVAHPFWSQLDCVPSLHSVQVIVLAWAKTTLYLHSKKATFTLSVSLPVRYKPTRCERFNPASTCWRACAGKVVDDKKVFRKVVNVQEENNNSQK